MPPWRTSLTTAERRRYLLDTHTFLWLAGGDSRVPRSLEKELGLPGRELWLSTASVWEIAIKKSLGKLELAIPLAQLVDSQCSAMALKLLEIRKDHALAVEELDFHHRDPFDRLLIAQALVEGLEIISRDTSLDAYPIVRIWTQDGDSKPGLSPR